MGGGNMLSTEYAKQGLIHYSDFYVFLRDHKIQKPGTRESVTMWEEIETIHDLYLKKKLKGVWYASLIKPVGKFFRSYSDEKKRLKVQLYGQEEADAMK